jgi:hypothetical protein
MVPDLIFSEASVVTIYINFNAVTYFKENCNLLSLRPVVSIVRDEINF